MQELLKKEIERLKQIGWSWFWIAIIGWMSFSVSMYINIQQTKFIQEKAENIRQEVIKG